MAGKPHPKNRKHSNNRREYPAPCACRKQCDLHPEEESTYIVTYRPRGKKLAPGEGGMMEREPNFSAACRTARNLDKNGYVILNILRVKS